MLHTEPPLLLKPPLEQVFPLFILMDIPPLALVETCVYALATSTAEESIVAGLP
jgi:hypothetical protein